LEDEVDGHVGDIDVRGLERDEMQPIEFSVNISNQVDLGDSQVNFVGTWNVLHGFFFEASGFDDVDVFKIDLIESTALRIVESEGLVVEGEVSHKWHESIQHIGHGGSVQRN